MILRLLQSNTIIYPIFAMAMAVSALIVIPKNLYKKFLLYGLILGGVGEVISVTSATYLGLIRYKSLPPFSMATTLILYGLLHGSFLPL